MSPIIAVRATLLRVGSAVFVGLIASTAMAQSLAAAPGPALEGTHWRAIELADTWRGPQQQPDLDAHLASVIEVARQGTVLLKNDGVLPIRPDVKSIAVIGGFSHLGMVSGGGGSSLVDPVGGFALNIPLGETNYLGAMRRLAITGPAPVVELGKQFPKAEILTEPGESAVDSAAIAKRADVPQVYLTDAAGDRRMRLLGFERVELAPGASRTVEVTADPSLLARFDGEAGQWRITDGVHRVALGRSAADLVSTAETPLAARVFGK